jgi:pimeloyl-[acyl-carrier protein] methyl ester esterase
MTLKINIKITGKGQPLVLLHGWGWHSGIWTPLVPQLAENFQLFLVDLPGFGKSPLLTADYKIETIAALLLENTPLDAHWLGWSLGGMIAWHIAIHHPTQVRRLITVASSPKFVREKNWPGVSPDTLAKFSHLLTEDYQHTLSDFLELQLRGAPKQPELITELKNQISLATTSLSALLNSLGLLQTLDLRSELKNMNCPSLHLFGSHDTLVPAAISQLIQPHLQQGKCEIIPRSGHMPFLSHRDIFLETICTFLS